ncbi:Coenzyme Q-binding protein COQ10-like B, mitochondrial, partial [Fragariocoptes setiger]
MQYVRASTRKYAERRLIGYSMEQLFDVVAQVEHYHKFVPCCRKSEVIQKNDSYIKAKLEIGLPPILESYTSHVKLERPHLVIAKCIDGVLFHHLDTRWRFAPGPDPLKTCHLDFNVSFEFKSLLYSRLAYLVFDEMVRLNVNAFLKRAEKLYGKQNPINEHHIGDGGNATA